MAGKFGPYHGPEQFTGFDHFGLGGTDGTFLRVTEDATPELYRLSQEFPEAFGVALQMLGGHLRRMIKTAMRSGGPQGAKWRELSYVHRYRRLDWARGGAYGKLKLKNKSNGRTFRLNERELAGAGNIQGSFSFIRGKKRGFTYTGGGRLRVKDLPFNGFVARWKGGKKFQRNQTAMGGRLVNAIRYERTRALSVEIGALNPSAAMYLKAVQAGKRGEPGVFGDAGSQEITPDMRRMFWAAGVNLGKKKKLQQPKRPLIYPIFMEEKPNMVPYILRRIEDFLSGRVKRSYTRRGKRYA